MLRLKKQLLSISFIFFLSFCGEVAGQINAVFIESPVKLDGILNEPAWENAEIITDFIQRGLIEGDPPSEKTEMRIIFDNNNIYIGVICFDSEPEKIIHREMKRDGDIGNDDRVSFVIDTYNDRRMAHLFSVNPNGMRFDATFQIGTRNDVNSEWDGIWDVSSRIMDYGWSCEVIIPFKTLRFPATETQTWAFNIKRQVKRKNEELLWRSWKQNDGIYQLSKAGTIHINKPVKSSRQFDAKPYILGGMENEQNSTPDNVFKYGFDLNYAITSNTTLLLTAKTDFAQIESDREVINLTRFDISYPEKRDFFLEGAELFEYKQGMTNVFYSRNIGISPERESMPILGGAKLTQKKGSYRLGIMTMQTQEDHGYPSANYSVVRIKKDIFKQAYVGMIATSIIDADGHDNQVYGADIVYRTDSFLSDKNFEIQSYLTGSVTDGSAKESMAGRIFFHYPNDTIDAFMLYHALGNNFNPEMGFISRDPGIQQYMFVFSYTPRTTLPFVKKFNFQPLYFNYYDDTKNRLVSRKISTTPFGFISESGDEFGFTIQNEYDCPDHNFIIFGDVIIPRGGYEWWSNKVNFETSKSRFIAFDLEAQLGDFYNGKKNRVNLECTFKTTRFYSISADVRYNNISINNRHFNTKEYGGRLEIDLSTRLYSSTFIQWNNETREANFNFRIHYIPKICSDVYIVYNHLMDEDDDYRTLQNAGMFKVNYTQRF